MFRRTARDEGLGIIIEDVTHETQVIAVVPIYNEQAAKEQKLGKSSVWWRRTERGEKLGWHWVVEIKIGKEFQENVVVGNRDVKPIFIVFFSGSIVKSVKSSYIPL